MSPNIFKICLNYLTTSQGQTKDPELLFETLLHMLPITALTRVVTTEKL